MLSEEQFGPRIYRGEVRHAFPTPEHPDPAKRAVEDPHGLLRDWTSSHYPFPKGYNGMSLSVGTHWTRSPEVIPERFVEPVLLRPQTGVPMGKREASAVSRRHAYDEPPETDWERVDQRRTQDRKNEAYLNRAEREGVNQYADLSGGDPARPGKAKPFKMAVVWEGHLPQRHQTGTNYEDEYDLPHESSVNVTGARLYVPPAGQERHDFSQRHPSVFSALERSVARQDVFSRSTYSHIGETTHVPWKRVQFEGAVPLPVKSRRPPSEYER